jgi:glycosyltransferase involved in cell wall biosynthesis
VADKASQVRVLIVHPRDPAAPTIGGIQTFLRDFVKYSPPDFEISIAGLTRDPTTRPVGRWTQLEIGGRDVSFLPVSPSGGVPRNPVALARTAAALIRLRRAIGVRDRILQVHRPYRAFVLAGHHGPLVQFVHLDIRDWPGPSGWPKLRSLYRQFSDDTLERMDRVFVVNEPGAMLLRTEHPRIADRIEFLPVWYDEEIFRPVDHEARQHLRGELAVSLGLDSAAATHDQFILLAVRLTEIKKPLLAIESLAELRRTTEFSARLVVAGEGELRYAAESRAAELGVQSYVHFLGDRPREDVAQLMQASDALLLTARSEGGGPRVVLEALACGLPVVSTTVVEVRRTVTAGSNGWLVDEARPELLAEGLAWVLAQPRNPMAEAAIDAARPYTARALLERVYQTYRGLAADSR